MSPDLPSPDQSVSTLTLHGHSGTTAPAAKLASWELIVFGIICTVDMIMTAVWYSHGVVDEANPLLAGFLHRSVTAFCAAKLLSFVPMLIICTAYRRRYPKLITIGLRLAIVAYIAIYAIGVGSQYAWLWAVENGLVRPGG